MKQTSDIQHFLTYNVLDSERSLDYHYIQMPLQVASDVLEE